MADTIFALSSGAPPAAIAIIRISGAESGNAIRALTGGRAVPPARSATLRHLSAPADGAALDDAILLWFPGPGSATGEDLAEIHCHGGRAVVRAIEAALAAMPGLRMAEPGEFTRRALMTGRIDLTQAEGLGDLLTAETEAARRVALDNSEGAVRRRVEDWEQRILALSAQAEAVLDHADEDDVDEAAVIATVRKGCAALGSEIATELSNAPVERLHDGIRVVLAGPPNAGKSTLLNRLVEREAAIVSPIAGTTRDRIEAAVQRNGVAYTFTDTAGLAPETDDPIEAIGIARAREATSVADIVLWLGDDERPELAGPRVVLMLHAQCDRPGREHPCEEGRLAVSALTGAGLSELWRVIERAAADLLPRLDLLALNRRQRSLCATTVSTLRLAADEGDTLLLAEHLRAARGAVDRITGRADVEAMLDSLFSRFCIGK